MYYSEMLEWHILHAYMECWNSTPFLPGLYSEYVGEWLRHFPVDERLHVVDGENLVAKPWEELERVQDFLEVPREITRGNFVRSTEKGFFCFRQSPGDRLVSCMDQAKGRRHEEISDDLKDALVEFFRPYNLKLVELLGRKFTWS